MLCSFSLLFFRYYSQVLAHTEQQPCCLSHKRFQYEIENLNLKKTIYIDALFRHTIKGVQKDKNIQAIFSSPNSKSF